MARTVRDTKLETRSARGKLESRGKPYYRAIEPGLHLGYRKPLAGSGKWVLRRYVGGEAYSVTTLATADDSSDADGTAILNFKQAQDAARDRMTAAAKRANPKVGPYTVAMAMDAYLEFLESEGRPASAIRDAKYKADAFIRPKLGNEDCAALTAATLRRWRSDIAKSPPRLRTAKGNKQKHKEMDGDDAKRARKASANRVWSVLRAALNFAFNEGKIPLDLEWRKVKSFKGTDGRRTRYLTLAEAKRLINSCEPAFRRMVQAALITGARWGQLCRLVGTDFNPDSGTLTLRSRKGDGTEKQYEAVLTDEGKRFFAEIRATVSDGELMFKNTGRTVRALELARRKHNQAGGKIEVHDRGDWRASEQERPMAEACERAKIDPPIGFHGLRHTWASLAVMNGVPLLVVAQNLGHSDTRMVELHYGHLAPSYKADAIRAGAPKFGFKSSNVRAL